MLIKGERTYMGLIEPADAPEIQKWLNEIELRRLCWTECPLPVNLEAARAWIKEMNQGQQTRLLSIRRLAEDDLVGLFTVRKLSWISRSVRFGSMIWPPSIWNQGIGTDARRAFLSYAFWQLGLRRVYGFFGDFNAASKRSHEKLGAEVTVRLREVVFVDGKFHDFCGYVYRRENCSCLPGKPDEIGNIPPRPHWKPGVAKTSIYRAYSDYYGLPGGDDPLSRQWLGDKHIKVTRHGTVVYLIEEIRRSAELLFFPRQGDQLRRDMVLAAVEHGFGDLNLHRIQVCLPSTVKTWGEIMLMAGFVDEGRLDGIIYANGTYLDLVFYGLLRPGVD